MKLKALSDNHRGTVKPCETFWKERTLRQRSSVVVQTEIFDFVEDLHNFTPTFGKIREAHVQK
uniref:Uncharacterized protein n=3 Tax=Oryza TaxID=4527 RepID=A0A0E0NC70_ORYRU